MADHFAEICSSTPRVPWTIPRQFSCFIRSSTGRNPSTDCQSRPRAASPQEREERDPLTQLSTRGISLTASRSSFYCSLLSHLLLFQDSFFNSLFNVPSILLHLLRLPFSFLRCSFIFSGTLVPAFLTFPPIL